MQIKQTMVQHIVVRGFIQQTVLWGMLLLTVTAAAALSNSTHHVAYSVSVV